MYFLFQQSKINHFFKIAEPSAPPVVDISDEATTAADNNSAMDANTAAVASAVDASVVADTNNNSSTDDRDDQHTSGPSNDPEEAMLKTKGTKKKSKVTRSRLGMSGPVVRTFVKRQRSDL